MKRWISLLMAAVLALSLTFTAVSCGRKSNTPEPAPAGTPVEPETPDTPEQPEGPDETEKPSPLMWRVTDGEGHTLYLFGTIHVGDQRNEAVFDRIAPVVDSCDALAVEFDVLAYGEDTERVMTDMTQYLLTDGSAITDYMPEELYQRAYELLAKAKMMPGIFTRYNLAWWSQMVESAMMAVYTDLDSEMAMDSMLIRHAGDKGMPVLEVESSDFQMALLNSFTNELYLLLIENSLDSAEDYDSDLTALYELWLSGDRDEFWAYLANEDEDAGELTEEQLALLQDYNRRLLDERNLGMRDRALEYLAGGQTVFFAVGAAHMANEAGLVQLLTDAGCTVETVEY